MTSAEESSTGLTPRVAAVLAYLAGPFSGVLVLLAERTSGYVRFHAWQSVLGLGALGIVVVMLLGFAFASLVVSARAFFVRMTLSGTGGHRTYQHQSSERVPADELCPAARRGE